jgi:thiol:disulfide interchange protein DsbD
MQVAAGGTGTARIAISILPGWHVNANPPALDYLIPTEVKLMGQPGLTVGRPVYPAPRRAKLSFEDTELLVYDGEAAIQVPVSAAAGAGAGRRVLRGEVKFQACNDQVCLAPASVPFEIAVTVTGGESGAQPPGTTGGAGASDTTGQAGAPVAGFATAPPAGVTYSPRRPGASGTENRLEEALARGGPGWLLLLFVGGLLLNLTPCVFPMLGVTVSIFGARRREPLPKVLAAAGLYVLGIALMYSGLGVVAALTGGLFGSVLQSSWVNVGLGLLLVGLSLSMFGLYEMQPPSWLLQRLGGADTTSAVGLLLSGLAVGIIAAPCIGPFVVAVLALIARRGDAMFGLQTMFALSIGLGFPYLFLATFSNLLQRLPRSGDWMLWVKKVFGVILASVGAFYALVGLAPRFTDWVLPAALVLGGIYLGFLDRTAAGRTVFRRMRMAGGALAVLAGVWLVATAPAKGIEFRPFDTEGLRTALATGRVVMLDFSADWCVPCHELERFTFTDARVKEAARSFATYQVDLTHYDSPDADRWRRQYGITGVPTVIFLAPDGSEVRDARVEGFLPPDRFLERMRLAAGR